MPKKRSWGILQKLPSGKWRARYKAPTDTATPLPTHSSPGSTRRAGLRPRNGSSAVTTGHHRRTASRRMPTSVRQPWPSTACAAETCFARTGVPSSVFLQDEGGRHIVELQRRFKVDVIPGRNLFARQR